MNKATNYPTIFGEIFEQDVIFCVDISGSMSLWLNVIKEQLILALTLHAKCKNKTMFNIVVFNSEITKWADVMVSCTEETVQVASYWIEKLEAKSGTNTLDALIAAFQDCECHAVYLISDGFPDTFKKNTMDDVIYEANCRPIHCINVVREILEPQVLEFFEDLAVQSFGSFHIIIFTLYSLTYHIITIYDANQHNQNINNSENSMLTMNKDTSDVISTLQRKQSDIRKNLTNNALSDISPSLDCHYRMYGMLPFQHPYLCDVDQVGRTSLARPDINLHTLRMEICESAASMLLGKTVLARKLSDGYFYFGIVQNQALYNKFVVALGQCDNKKIVEPTYQQTSVINIVDHSEAQRHDIAIGDYVLAPWHPDCEKYGPGIIINAKDAQQHDSVSSSHEADGKINNKYNSVDDQEERKIVGIINHAVTVKFSDGHTECVTKNMALWIPEALYKRVSLELNMTKEVRHNVNATNEYMYQCLTACPTYRCQQLPFPLPTASNFAVDHDILYENSKHTIKPLHNCVYPLYSDPYYNDLKESRNTISTGTSMNTPEKMENVLEYGDTKDHQRQQNLKDMFRLFEGNNACKSVRFSESDSNAALSTLSSDKSECNNEEQGHDELLKKHEKDVCEDICQNLQIDVGGHQRKEEQKKFDREKLLIKKPFEALSINEQSNCSNSKLHLCHPNGIGGRPCWHYSCNHHKLHNARSKIARKKTKQYLRQEAGSRKVNFPEAFKETAQLAPLEARNQHRSPFIVEWTSPNFNYVDTFAKYNHCNSVEKCLKNTAHLNEAMDKNIAVPVVNTSTDEQKTDVKNAFRRKRFIMREIERNNKLQTEDRMAILMQDNHRERILAQMEREKVREKQEYDVMHKRRETKKKLGVQLKARIEANQRREQEREDNRIIALRKKREHRESLEDQRRREIEENERRSVELQKEHCLSRHNAATARLDEEEGKERAQDAVRRKAKLDRRSNFNKIENYAQAKKNLSIVVQEQSQAIYRSHVLA